MGTIIPLPLWLPYVNRELATTSLPLIQISLMLCWLVVNFSAWVTYFKLWSARKRVFQLGSKFEHLLVISTYKEPLSLLISTIETIQIQELAKSNVNLAISFEERTPELNEKIKSLTDRFQGSPDMFILYYFAFILDANISVLTMSITLYAIISSFNINSGSKS